MKTNNNFESDALKRIVYLVLVAAAFLVMNKLTAAEISVLSVTSDEDKKVTVLKVKTNKHGNIIGLYSDVYLPSRRREKRISEDVNTLESARGIVLLEKKGRDVIVLRSENFTMEYGGTLVLDTLKNGITGSRLRYRVELNRDGNNWYATYKGRRLPRAHFQTNKIAGQVVGIKNFITRFKKNK